MEGWEKNSHKLSCNVVASTTNAKNNCKKKPIYL